MIARCPGQCAIGKQRLLELREISQISTKARAEITLLKTTAVLCESCGIEQVGDRRCFYLAVSVKAHVSPCRQFQR